MKLPTPGEIVAIGREGIGDPRSDVEATAIRLATLYVEAAYAAIRDALREEAKLQAHTFYNGALVIVANAIDAALSSNPSAKEK